MDSCLRGRWEEFYGYVIEVREKSFTVGLCSFFFFNFGLSDVINDIQKLKSVKIIQIVCVCVHACPLVIFKFMEYYSIWGLC